MAVNACGIETSSGVVILWKDPGDSTYKSIGGVTEFPQFAFTHGTASCNEDNASSNGWATRYKNGKLDAGSSTISYNWKPGDLIQGEMWDEFVGTGVSSFRMQWSDINATKLDFDANVIGFDVSTPPTTDDDNVVTRSISIELTGEPIWG